MEGEKQEKKLTVATVIAQSSQVFNIDWMKFCSAVYERKLFRILSSSDGYFVARYPALNPKAETHAD